MPINILFISSEQDIFILWPSLPPKSMEAAKSSSLAHFLLLVCFVQSSTRSRKISILRREVLGTVGWVQTHLPPGHPAVSGSGITWW